MVRKHKFLRYTFFLKQLTIRVGVNVGVEENSLVVFWVETDRDAIINNLLLEIVEDLHSVCCDFLRCVKFLKHDVADE